jgi:hypothetical protein
MDSTKPFGILIILFFSTKKLLTALSSLPHFYGRTISTYPMNPATGKREGDPICDAFGFDFYPGLHTR